MHEDLGQLNDRLEETIAARADFQRQQADEERQLHECLDALCRIDQAIYLHSMGFQLMSQRAETYRILRQDLEEVARYTQVLQYLHKPLR